MHATTRFHGGITNLVLQEIETTARRQGVFGQFSQTFILYLPCIGVTPEAHLTRLLDHEEGYDHVAFLLTLVAFLLALGIGWAVDRSLRTLMPTRGDGACPAAV